MRRQQVAGWAVAAGSVAVVAVGLGAGTGPVVNSMPGGTVTYPTVPGSGTPTVTEPHLVTPSIAHPVGPSMPAHSGDVVVAVVVGLAAAVAIVLVVRALLRWLRSVEEGPASTEALVAYDAEGTPAPSDSTADGLLGGVERAQDVLDEEHDARQAVLACWLRLEEAVAQSSTVRAASESPGELTRRVMMSYSVDDRALQLLYDLYRRARYSMVPVPAAARTQARGALSAIRSSLETRPIPVTSIPPGQVRR